MLTRCLSDEKHNSEDDQCNHKNHCKENANYLPSA